MTFYLGYAVNLYSSLSIMGDQPARTRTSLEELNVWKVEKLQKYLKDHGIVITGNTRKGNLVSKVYYASRLHLRLCSTKKQEQAQIAPGRKEKLLIN